MAVKRTIGKMMHPRDGEVWVNPVTEAMRKDECLCLPTGGNCANLKPNQPDNCPIAQALFEACVAGKTALMVTRCSLYQPKTEQ